MKRNKSYENELVALIKSGVKPEDAVRIANEHIGNFEMVKKQIEQERNEVHHFNAGLDYYCNEINALIKSGKSPQEAVEITNSHIGNVDLCIKEIEQDRQI